MVPWILENSRSVCIVLRLPSYQLVAFNIAFLTISPTQVPLDRHDIIIDKVLSINDKTFLGIIFCFHWHCLCVIYFIGIIHNFDVLKVAASYDNNHIVAVTSNNMVRTFQNYRWIQKKKRRSFPHLNVSKQSLLMQVCIWRRTEEEAGGD